MTPSRIAGWLMFLPIVCQALRPLSDDSGLAFTVVMAVLLIPVMRFWWKAELPATTDEERSGGWRVFAVIFAVALVFRLVALDRVPETLDHDAGLNAGIAAELVALGHWVPFAPQTGIGTETAFFYLIAALFELCGHSVWTLRFAGVLMGAVGLWALFLFARELFGRRVAFVACALCAISPYTVLMHRTPKHSLLVPPVLCLTYYLLLRASRSGRLWTYALAGVAIGAGMQTYAAYRHGIVVALLYLLWTRPTRKALLATFGGVAVVLLPMAPHVLWRGRDWLDPLAQNTSVMAALHDPMGLLVHLSANTSEVIYTALLLRPGEAIGIQTWVGVLTLGALPLLARRSDPRLLLLAWISVAMIVAPIGARFDHGAPRRYVGLLPLIFVVPALVLVHLPAHLGESMRRAWAAWAVALGLFLAVMAGLHTYHQSAPQDTVTQRTAVLRAAHDLVRERPDVHVYLPDGYSMHGFFALRFFFLHPRIHELPNDDPFNIPADVTAVIVPDHTLTAERLTDSLPAGIARKVPLGVELDREGWSALRGSGDLYHVPRDGARARGLHAGAAPPGATRWALDPQRIHNAYRAAPLSPDRPTATLAAKHEIPHDLPHGLAVSSDAFYVATLENVRRYRRGEPPVLDEAWRLRGPDGPIDSDWQYRILPDKPWSIAVRDGELVVSNRGGRWVARFAHDGTRRSVIGADWKDPVDIALHADGRCAVADLEARVVRVYSADNRLLSTLAVARPVALTWSGARLAVLDGASRDIVLYDGSEVSARRFVGRVDLASRLSAGGGRLVLSQRARVRLFDSELRAVQIDAGAGASLAALDAKDQRWTASAMTAGRLYLLSEYAELRIWQLPE